MSLRRIQADFDARWRAVHPPHHEPPRVMRRGWGKRTRWRRGPATFADWVMSTYDHRDAINEAAAIRYRGMEKLLEVFGRFS